MVAITLPDGSVRKYDGAVTGAAVAADIGPGLAKAAPAYGLTPAELEARAAEFNPIERVSILAKAKIPAAFIHGDVDKVVPLKENSAELVRRYQAEGAGDLVKLIVLEGQGHNFFEGFFHSQPLVDFAIARAQAGAKP